MTSTRSRRWQSRRTKESMQIERLLQEAGFEKVDAYRYNAASIRVRVIDPRFEGKSVEKRHAMVERHLAKLPEDIQRDILMLLTFAPSEMESQNKGLKQFWLNLEFEDPSPSLL